MPIRLGSLLLLLGAARAAAQTYPLDKCDRNAVAVGYLRAHGTVRYALGKDGRPDPASIQVVGIDSGGVAAFQSAAQRQLSICRMHRPDAPLTVVQGIRFDSATIALDPAAPARGTETPLPVDTAAWGDAERPDETPRFVACDRPPRTVPVSTSGRSAAQDQGMFAQASPLNHGMIITRLILGSDGRVVPDSVTLVSSDNPANSSNLLRAIATCHFTPARREGRPIAVRLSAAMIVGENGYSVTPMPGTTSVGH